MTRTVPPGRRERARVLDQVVDDLAQARVVSRHLKSAHPAAIESQGHVTPSSRLTSLATVTSVLEQLGEIDRRRFLALQLGIEAAGIGNVRDEAIEPLHVVLDDG